MNSNFSEPYFSIVQYPTHDRLTFYRGIGEMAFFSLDDLCVVKFYGLQSSGHPGVGFRFLRETPTLGTIFGEILEVSGPCSMKARCQTRLLEK